MYQIRDWLYIGNYAQTRDLNLLKQHGIQAMLQLADYAPQPDMDTLYVAVEDGEAIPQDRIKKGVQFVRGQRAADKRVLVACGAGISRSTLFVVATLMEEESRDLFDAYYEVYKQYENAEPHPELIVSLSAYHGEQLRLGEAWDQLWAVRKRVNKEAEGKSH